VQPPSERHDGRVMVRQHDDEEHVGAEEHESDGQHDANGSSDVSHDTDDLGGVFDET